MFHRTENDNETMECIVLFGFVLSNISYVFPSEEKYFVGGDIWSFRNASLDKYISIDVGNICHFAHPEIPRLGPLLRLSITTDTFGHSSVLLRSLHSVLHPIIAN